MKKIMIIICGVVFIAVLAIAAYFLVPNSGRVQHAKINVGSSEKFSRQEIDSAINYMIDYFKKNFHRCKLIELKYNEEESNALIKSDMTYGRGASNGATADNMIVLIMEYHTGVIGIGPVWSPNCTYVDQCILIRDNKDSEWKREAMGY